MKKRPGEPLVPEMRLGGAHQLRSHRVTRCQLAGLQLATETSALLLSHAAQLFDALDLSSYVGTTEVELGRELRESALNWLDVEHRYLGVIELVAIRGKVGPVDASHSPVDGELAAERRAQPWEEVLCNEIDLCLWADDRTEILQRQGWPILIRAVSEDNARPVALAKQRLLESQYGRLAVDDEHVGLGCG